MTHHPFDNGNHDREPRLQLTVELAKPLDETRAASAGDLDAATAQKCDQDQCRQAQQRFHDE
ncbi:MAG: Uncharacterised protein [Synechococcus sp. MIT S9220]|nr:MAG: Uncharacterised protein [Synechococcus sp. MIT S9220]